MELSLETDGAVAAIRVKGPVSMAETAALSDYLRVARENGALRCIVDLADCSWLPTTIVPLLLREAGAFSRSGGALSLSGVADQNPFLRQAVTSGRLGAYRTFDEASAGERRAVPVDAPKDDP